jgi:hypothetical protein
MYRFLEQNRFYWIGECQNHGCEPQFGVTKVSSILILIKTNVENQTQAMIRLWELKLEMAYWRMQAVLQAGRTFDYKKLSGR